MGGACCGSCSKGGPCEGGAASCASKGSAGALGISAPAHPIVARARTTTGTQHAAHQHPAPRASGDISSQSTEAIAGTYAPTDDELARMGTTRARWATMSTGERTSRIAGIEGAPRGDVVPGSAAADARVATLDEDDAAFQAALARVPEGERAALVRDHMRARGASEAATNAALFRLAEQGLRGINDYFNRELQEELLRIRTAGTTEQERLRQEGLTARAEIDARQRQYENDHPRYVPPAAPAAPAQNNNTVLYLGVAVGVVGVVAALVMASRASASRRDR